MLAVDKLLPNDGESGFQSVCFFDRHGYNPAETGAKIPGAVPFPGSFIDTMLWEENPEPAEGTSANNDYQALRNTMLMVRQYAPFDVVNFDLEEVLFTSEEEPPGKLLRALKKLFEIQRDGFSTMAAQEFSLMMTVRLPEHGAIHPEALALVRSVLDANIRKFPELHSLFTWNDAPWSRAFELAIPKIILEQLHATGWTISGASGIQEVTRERQNGGPQAEQLYHIIVDVVRRHDTEKEAEAAYRKLMHDLFRSSAHHITDDSIAQEVRMNLKRVHVARDKLSARLPRW